MKTELLSILPVLPSQDIDRDVEWYAKYVGFDYLYKDKMYAVLKRDELSIHLQWHADTEDDPLLGGSVIRIRVNAIQPAFEEFLGRGTVEEGKLSRNTAWNTHEFGFYDLNKNAIFMVEFL